jgi:hypothetical protein
MHPISLATADEQNCFGNLSSNGYIASLIFQEIMPLDKNEKTTQDHGEAT